MYKQLRKLCDDRRERQRTGLFPVAGAMHLLQEAVACGIAVDRVAATPEVMAKLQSGDVFATARGQLPLQMAFSAELMASLVPVESTAPIFFTCPLPSQQLSSDILQSGKHLVLDGVQDPGNVGTLLRTAAAFGFSSVVTLSGTADIYSPKVVRATAGALFQLNAFTVARADLLVMLNDIDCYVAAHADNALTPSHLQGRDGLLVIGNEGAGVSEALRNAATAVVSIPIGSDSLNAAVAGGILMWEMRR